MSAPSCGDCAPGLDRGFVACIVNDLLDHKGEWRRLGAIHAPQMDCAERAKLIGKAVDCARRFGLVIQGHRQFGYRLVGWEQPKAYTRAAALACEAEAVDREAANALR